MTQEILDHVFSIDKETTTNGTDNESGTGLGLVLCKEFVEKNGGSIEVASEINKGTKVTLTLPFAKNSD